MTDETEPDVTVTVSEPEPEPEPEPEIEFVEGGDATVIVAPATDSAQDSVSLAERVAVLENQMNADDTGVLPRLSAVEITAGTAAILAAEDAAAIEEMPEVAEEVAADVVEDSTIEKNEEGQLEIDAPEPDSPPRSHGPSPLFMTRQEWRDRRANR